jgi:hypothetical protein
MDVPIGELAAHITERGNPGNQWGIRAAEVQVPAEFLRRGFTFVDTPGLASAIRANTRTTEAFLPEADALILVSSHDSPLSEEEAQILAAARGAGRPLFVILNKQDMVDAGAREEALAHVATIARESGGTAPVAVFSVSARDGLAAKQAGDAAALAASGLPALEAALVDFLLTRRRGVFLAGMCARIVPLLGPPMPTEFAEQLAAVRARIAEAAGPVAAPVEAAFAPLLPGCEICAAVMRAAFDFLSGYQAVLYADRSAQQDLARRGGFCRAHARQFEAIAATREAATAFAPLLLRQASALRRIAAADPPPALAADMVADLLPTGATCPVCAVAQQAERAKIAALAAMVAAQGAEAVYAGSALCLPHLGRLLAALPAGAARRTLLRQAALMERVAEDAQRFALRQDAARRDILSKEDHTAVERSARVLLDHPNAQHEPAPDAALHGTTRRERS